MDNSIFADALGSPAHKVWELLRDSLQEHFKAFYYGDPVVIPESLMPCIVVDTLTSASELGMTGHDDLTQVVVVKIVFNKKDDFNASDQEFITKQKVEFFAEGRDKTTGEYLPVTVQGVLRKNITVDYNAGQFTDSINYDVIIRPEDTITQEAHITLTINASIPVSNRS